MVDSIGMAILQNTFDYLKLLVNTLDLVGMVIMVDQVSLESNCSSATKLALIEPNWYIWPILALISSNWPELA